MSRVVGGLVAFALLAASVSAQQSAPESWSKIESALQRKGKAQPGGLFKFSMPRTDLHVVVGNIPIQPALALGSWAAFSSPGPHAAVMGDLVLRESELQPVLSKLENGGIEITAIHNHLVGEQPRVLYAHIHGQGDAAQLAAALHAALALTATPGAPPKASMETGGPQLNRPKLESIFRSQANVAGTVLQFAFPRSELIREAGMEVPPPMGVASAINLQPLPNGRAATAGDLVLRASEVNPVIRTLRENGIDVVAVHSHMLDEEPRLFFLHFWAVGEPEALARGLRDALAKTRLAPVR